MFESDFLLFQKTLSHDSVTSSTGRQRWPLYELGEGSFVLPDPVQELDASCRNLFQHRLIDDKEAFDGKAFLMAKSLERTNPGLLWRTSLANNAVI